MINFTSSTELKSRVAKKLGSVVALLQGKFEKNHKFKANFEREKNTQF